MQRFAATIFLAVVSMTALHAENQIGLSAGAGPAFPIRGIERMFGIGYGGSGSIDFFLNDNISVVARGGYFRWQFSSDRINASVAASGGVTGFDVRGPFQAIPVTVGARFTFDGEFLRPYFGLAGGACFLHWRIAGSAAAPGAQPASGGLSGTWTEPAMSVDAGFMFVLSHSLRLDIGGTYTAFSNADDRIEPSEFLGMKITGANTATFVGVQAGFTVAF
jgi:hypothetical protein